MLAKYVYINCKWLHVVEQDDAKKILYGELALNVKKTERDKNPDTCQNMTVQNKYNIAVKIVNLV